MAPKGQGLVDVNDLTGGLNRRASLSTMPKNRSRKLQNVRVSNPGEWTPRPGWDVLSTSSLGARRVQGANRIYLAGVVPFTLAADNGSVYTPTDPGVWGSADVTGRHATNAIYFPYDPTMVAVVDGSTAPKKSLDGSTWSNFGITAPTAAPTFTLNASGTLTDAHTFEFSYSYEDEAGLAVGSNESPTATQATATPNLSINVICPFSADTQVDQIYVYARDVTAGETVRRFAGQVANPGSGTATVVVSSNTWSAETEAPTRRTVPPSDLVYAFVWKNRWWGIRASDLTTLQFTEVFEPQSWPTNYSIAMPFTRGDTIKWAGPVGDSVVILGASNQVFILTAQTPFDFEVRPSASAEAGATGFRAATVTPLGLAHAAATGVYLFTGASDTRLTDDYETDWRSAMAAASVSELSNLPMVYHVRDKELRIALPTLSPYAASGELVLDVARMTTEGRPVWTTTDRVIGGYYLWDGPELTAGFQGRLFSWRVATAELVEESTGLSANGADQTLDYEGAELNPTGRRTAQFGTIFFDVEPNDGVFSAEILVDGVSVWSPTIDIDNGLARYGTAVYGTDTYAGGSRLTVPVELPLEAEGQQLQVLGQYVGQAPFRWFGYGVTATPEPELDAL